MKINYKETTIITRCPICGHANFVEANEADYWDWQDGALAQDAFPYLSAEEREALISGICPSCWANTFGDPEEEEDSATYEFEPGHVYWNEMAANP